MSVTAPQHSRPCRSSSRCTSSVSQTDGSPEISIPSYPQRARRSMVVSIGSWRIQLCIANFTGGLLLSKAQLPRIHNPVRIERGLDAPHRAQGRAVLALHVRRELQPHAVVVVDHTTRGEHGLHAVIPDSIVEPDALLAYRGERALGLDGHGLGLALEAEDGAHALELLAHHGREREARGLVVVH